MKRLTSSLEKRKRKLQQNRYLSGLDDRILTFLAENTNLFFYKAEEVILREGQLCLGLYIIESGRVKVFRYSSTGREMVINVFGSGDSFNEVPVFDELENPVNAEAVLDTKIWLINAAALRYVIKTHPDAAQKIIINLSQNLRMLVHKVAELTFYTVTGRLARLLRELPADQLSGPQRLTQDDLASRIGSVREVVARSLKELEDVGAIDLNRGEIKIIDQDILVDWE